jgi:hypothetical protein
VTCTTNHYLKSMLSNPWLPIKAPSSSGTCVDTAGWVDIHGNGCEVYRSDDPGSGCPEEGSDYVGDMGPAAKNCCYCKDPTVSQIHSLRWNHFDFDVIECIMHLIQFRWLQIIVQCSNGNVNNTQTQQPQTNTIGGRTIQIV